MIPVAVCRLPHGQDLPLPERATPHAAGMDLRAAIPEGETWVLAPGERRLVPTGLVVAIPPGYEGQVRPRSGLAFKQGVTVLNAPGTIDADYRGEVQVLLINHGSAPFLFQRGERVAQFLWPRARLVLARGTSTAALGDTQRGDGGYGSTGRSLGVGAGPSMAPCLRPWFAGATLKNVGVVFPTRAASAKVQHGGR